MNIISVWIFRRIQIRVYELLVNIAKDKILIMATHDQSLLKGNEKVYVFDNYRVREV